MKFKTKETGKLFFTADTHFGHARIIEYCDRPWDSVDKMNEGLIENWNSVVPKDGVVIHAGDVAFCDPTKIIPQLNGKIILVKGNHDSDKFDHLYWKTCELLSVKAGKQRIVVQHYCMRVWDQSHRNSWHFFGHSHGRLAPKGKSWDIGVDANHYKPLSFTEMSILMSNQPDNENVFKS